ncbi:endoplasmic reticulum-Golgi intermediate compartment protein 2 [Agrilus planipennis]|uniref:Endoplasmic reticulum-Golgi intermediate compartment protein 2 n=1 Tax=Agrilus planipennis TaxID=224129 RepID=A0A1W4WFI3_AGRPL|nr:endoplasmic reticulum-Golgi intermediate compartment protein 2 [Agrilus planipennis]
METDKLTLIRQRPSKFSKIKELDFFPKLDETYKETSPVGGMVSVVCFGIIFWLIYSEINYYLHSKLIFKFSPDTDFDAKLKLNVDITVATPCHAIGADVVDDTSEHIITTDFIKEEDTWFELSPNQRQYFDHKNFMNSYLCEEYHAVQDLLWRSEFSSVYSDMPEREDKPKRPHDACRIHGSLILNKVEGLFHIIAGRTVELPRGHLHLNIFDSNFNFSHRINRLSFGDPSPGIVHPLEGDEQITEQRNTLYQYFIEVVPTNIQTFMSNMDTFQYSVKSLTREINHDSGSHGVPGIFIKYDMSSLKVTVRQERDHLGMFLARLCSVVGGVYVCSGFINALLQFLANIILCKWEFKKVTDVNEKPKSVFHQNISTHASNNTKTLEVY